MKRKGLKKLIILNIPYVIVGLFATNIGQAFRLASGTGASEKLQSLVFDGCIKAAFSDPMPSFYPTDLLIGAAIGGMLRLAVFMKSKNTLPVSAVIRVKAQTKGAPAWSTSCISHTGPSC